MNLNLIDDKKKAGVEVIIVIDKQIKSDKEILNTLNFIGKDETYAFVPENKKLYVGCEKPTKENIKIAMAIAIRQLKKTNYKTAQIFVTSYLREILEGLLLGNYTFEKYKSNKKNNKITFNIIVPKINSEFKKIFNEMKIICNSVNLTRDFVNTTPEDFYPKIMAKKAKKISKNNNLEYKIFGDKYFKANSMGCISAVGRASSHKSKLIHLTYKPKGEIKKKIVLVGKGLTYDSGGLSLKPSDFMVTMKLDKSGGCAVLGLMNAISQLNLPVEVHGIVGAVENMVGGNAYKPDDVLTARNGKTVEVRNTDAEGRLVLADCLCYAQDEIKNIDYILDYATLTGASAVAVGHYTTSIMGNNQKLKELVASCGNKSGDLATFLDFNKYLKDKINSKVADICNISSTKYGGAITAGLFLNEFIKKENKDKWIHCDIAGPAYVEEEWGYNCYGASGVGVRMTLEFIGAIIK